MAGSLGIRSLRGVVLEPADVEVVSTLRDLLACEAAPAARSAGVLARGRRGGPAEWVAAEHVFELVTRLAGGRFRRRAEVVAGEGRALAELRHVGAHVVHPHFPGVAFVGLPAA